MKIKATVLGCGGSFGVPELGCKCETCLSKNPKNKRTRTSLHLSFEDGASVVIDTGPDFRVQALANNISDIDAVLYTHGHADHFHGLDDLRSILIRKKFDIDVFSDAATYVRLEKTFGYFFAGNAFVKKPGVVRQNLKYHEIIPGSIFEYRGVKIMPFSVDHSKDQVTCFKIGDLTYIPDVSSIPDAALRIIQGSKFLLIDALSHSPTTKHLSLMQAVEISQKVRAERTITVHMRDDIEYERDSKLLPPGVELGYDGLTFEFNGG